MCERDSDSMFDKIKKKMQFCLHSTKIFLYAKYKQWWITFGLVLHQARYVAEITKLINKYNILNSNFSVNNIADALRNRMRYTLY